MDLGLVVSTLGRVESLKRLFDSLSDQLFANDTLVVVAQRDLPAVEALASGYRSENMRIIVTTSPPGAARGRNAGVAVLPADRDLLLNFPNDTTWYPPGALQRMRLLAEDFRAGALTVVDENGPKFVLPEPGATLNRWSVWSVIEMGILIRRSVFDRIGGFDPEIGTGALTPWQAGEATDLLLKLIRAGEHPGFAWQPPALTVGHRSARRRSNWARACSMESTATRRSRLFCSARTMRRCSRSSPK